MNEHYCRQYSVQYSGVPIYSRTGRENVLVGETMPCLASRRKRAQPLRGFFIRILGQRIEQRLFMLTFLAGLIGHHGMHVLRRITRDPSW